MRDARRSGPAGVGEDGFGDGNDLRGRSVVLVEPHHVRAAELLAKSREPGRVGAGEGEDRLVGVADDGEVAPVPEPAPHEPELRRADILELVDEEVPEPEPLLVRELRVVAERVGAPPEQIVEVDQP